MNIKSIMLMTVMMFSLCASGQVDVRNIEIRQNGDRSEISFDARIDKKAAKSNYKLIITPVFYSGGQSLELAPIVVETRRTRIMDSRNGVAPFPGAVLTENGKTVRYTASVYYADWLSNSDLRFDLLSAGCCTEQDLAPLIFANSVSAAPPPPPSGSVSVRVGGMILILDKNSAVLPLRSASGRSLLSRHEVGFAQGISMLDPYSFGNNRTMNDIIEALRSSEGSVRGRIEITGYASPEGPQANNYALAQNRALAVRNYILDNVSSLRPANFDIINGGENWEGLYKIVEESLMPGRWQVLNIIETTPPDIDYARNTSRKKMLMDLNGGQTWNYMLANFFPQLRSAATVAIYASADGSRAALQDMPPAQNTEIINRAVNLIGERNSSAALTLLAQVSDDPRAWNPMGVCYVLENNIAGAAEYFRMAAEAGYGEAKANLEQINR